MHLSVEGQQDQVDFPADRFAALRISTRNEPADCRSSLVQAPCHFPGANQEAYGGMIL
jgi:hypothetical protein